MDSTFSLELKELVAQSREIALDLGYGYISTIHFFLADCESNRADSILKFVFKSELEYQIFRKNCKLEKTDFLEFTDESLPLTKEAEITIRLSETERKLQTHNLVFPRHLFIAALKNKESLLFEYLMHDTNALDKLIDYYKVFDQINNLNGPRQETKERFNFFQKIKKVFGLEK